MPSDAVTSRTADVFFLQSSPLAYTHTEKYFPNLIKSNRNLIVVTIFLSVCCSKSIEKMLCKI